MSERSEIYRDTQIDIILPCLKINSRKKAFQELAQIIGAQINYPPHALFHLMMDKEYHDSSNIGDGVSIPNLKLQQLQKPFTILAVLDKPINFEMGDEENVDIICALFSPERDGPIHLRRLSRISRLLKDQKLCDKIRKAGDEEIIRSLLVSPEGWLLAA